MDGKRVSWILISIFVGIVLGTVFANLLERTQPELLYVFAVDQYVTVRQGGGDWKAFGQYLLQQRGMQGIGMLLICLFCNTIFLMIVLGVSGGFIWGVILSVETMRMGLQGLFLGIVCFLPHGICYAIAIWLFLVGKEEVRQRTEVPVRLWLQWFLVPIVMAIGGIALEIWASPELLVWILN